MADKQLIGTQDITLKKATITISNPQGAKPNSVKIIETVTNTTIAENLPVSNTLTFNKVFRFNEGNSYKFQARLTDLNGDIVSSPSVNVTVKVYNKPTVTNFDIYKNESPLPKQYDLPMSLLPDELRFESTHASNISSLSLYKSSLKNGEHKIMDLITPRSPYDYTDPIILDEPSIRFILKGIDTKGNNFKSNTITFTVKNMNKPGIVDFDLPDIINQ